MDEVMERLASTPVEGAADRGGRDALTWLITGGAMARRTTCPVPGAGAKGEVASDDARVAPQEVLGDIDPQGDPASKRHRNEYRVLTRGDPREHSTWMHVAIGLSIVA